MYFCVANVKERYPDTKTYVFYLYKMGRKHKKHKKYSITGTVGTVGGLKASETTPALQASPVLTAPSTTPVAITSIVSALNASPSFTLTSIQSGELKMSSDLSTAILDDYQPRDVTTEVTTEHEVTTQNEVTTEIEVTTQNEVENKVTTDHEVNEVELIEKEEPDDSWMVTKVIRGVWSVLTPWSRQAVH